MKSCIPIRTQAGKLYGTLDAETYMLKIKDGAVMRTVQIPPEGTKLEYISPNKKSETIYIPPKPICSDSFR